MDNYRLVCSFSSQEIWASSHSPPARGWGPVERRAGQRRSSGIGPASSLGGRPKLRPGSGGGGSCRSKTRKGSRPFLSHGTTTATNAILEGKTPPTALVTTAGFKYVLEIGRHDIPRHGNLYGWSKPTRPGPSPMVEGSVDGTADNVPPLHSKHD